MSKAIYTKFAKEYDTCWARFSDITIAQALAQLPQDLTHKTILDVGCGTGILIRKLLKIHPEIDSITGIDVSESMLQIANRKFKGHNKVQLIYQAGETMDVPERSFDIVISTNTFHYFPSPVGKLQEMKNVLKNDGILILEDYSKDGVVAKYFEWAIKLYDQWHYKAVTLDEGEGMIAQAGFGACYAANFPIDVFWKGWVIQAKKE